MKSPSENQFILLLRAWASDQPELRYWLPNGTPDNAIRFTAIALSHLFHASPRTKGRTRRALADHTKTAPRSVTKYLRYAVEAGLLSTYIGGKGRDPRTISYRLTPRGEEAFRDARSRLPGKWRLHVKRLQLLPNPYPRSIVIEAAIQDYLERELANETPHDQMKLTAGIIATKTGLPLETVRKHLKRRPKTGWPAPPPRP